MQKDAKPPLTESPPEHEQIESAVQVPETAPREFTITVKQGVYIDGKRDSGKTELIRYLLQTLPYKFYVFDVIGNLKEFSDHKKYPNIEYHLVNPHNVEQIEPLFQNLLQRAQQYAQWAEQNKVPEDDYNFGMMVLDEADRYDYYTGVKNTLNDIINLARNYGLGYIAAARRTAAVAKDIIANADWLFIFRCVYTRDQKILAEWIDVRPDTLRDLDDHEFLIVYHGEAVGRSKLEL